MPITRSWSETIDGATTPPDQIDELIEQARQDIRERIADGHHLDFLANPNLAALHVSSDSESHFPIFDATGTNKLHGFGSGIRVIRPSGTSGPDDHVVQRVEADDIPTGTIPTLLTVAIVTDPSAYVFFTKLVGMASAGGGVLSDWEVFYVTRNGGAPFIADTDPIASQGATLANAPSISGNNVLIRVNNTTGANANAVVIVEYFRVN